LILLFAMPIVNTVYTAVGGSGFSGVILRGIVASICLLPPTLMMGATLPAVARWVETTPKGVSWMGFFYGGNLVSALHGSLLAAFSRLRVFDMSLATYVAVAINVLVASMGLVLAKATSYAPSATPASSTPISHAPGARLVYLTIAISGMTALSAEVIWTRLL